MSIQSVEISNILSFQYIKVDGLEDVNCILGRNNAGKSNFLKCISFFYKNLESYGNTALNLNSNYSYKGYISITFDIRKVIAMCLSNPSNDFFLKVLNIFDYDIFNYYSDDSYNGNYIKITLDIYNDNKISWSEGTNKNGVNKLIKYLFPFFYIEPRHMDLHNWDDIWELISSIKSFKTSNVDREAVLSFFDDSLNKSGTYKKYINELDDVLNTKKSTQKEKILSYIKVGLKGYNFEIDEKDLSLNSDGTNSFNYIKTYLKILINLSRDEYISPIIIIDEPELGLHPIMNEDLIYEIFYSFNYNENSGRYRNSLVFLNTHSQNIVKSIIKIFRSNQTVINFKYNGRYTTSHKLNSKIENESLINIFNDNESRLFFSHFILFVEGETELEVFGNSKLKEKFPHLRKIDVYKSSSNTVGEGMNPSCSKSDIPYLYLFDADKAIDFKTDRATGKIRINTKKNGNYFNLNYKNLRENSYKYKFGYNEKYKNIEFSMQEIIRYNNDPFIFDKVRQNSHVFIDLRYHINRYLYDKSIYILPATIESVLISKHSSGLLSDWLQVKKNIDISKKIKKAMDSKYLDIETLMIYISLSFGGKTFLNNKEEYFKSPRLTHNSRAMKISRIVNAGLLSNLNIDKTNGWVSDFINFSIEKIVEQSLKEKVTFNQLFNAYFPDLYDIIEVLRLDRG